MVKESGNSSINLNTSLSSFPASVSSIQVNNNTQENKAAKSNVNKDPSNKKKKLADAIIDLVSSSDEDIDGKSVQSCSSDIQILDTIADKTTCALKDIDNVHLRLYVLKL